VRHSGNHFVRSNDPDVALPESEDAIAFAPVWQLSRWIESRKLTSTRLTEIYLRRLERYNAQLRCVITLTREHALVQARRADARLRRGSIAARCMAFRGARKTFSIRPGFRRPTGQSLSRSRSCSGRDRDGTAQRAGAVLVAKLSLGALALNDIWFGGQTMNPWLLEEGSSGSSAGPGAAVGAGLVGFAIGSETGGSIVSPTMRCGVTGLRPTFGRVPRTGAMTLCWSLDKLGPMARSVEDTIMVVNAISGPDGLDLASVPSELAFDATQSVSGLRVGYFPKWMKEDPATDVDRAALQAVKKLGMVPVEVSIPDWPYDSLNLILFAEAAAV
jgi:Asp-tRNA(Asn)/Glu-tRNA(Gln) amidotransferase A subunit family amidase